MNSLLFILFFSIIDCSIVAFATRNANNKPKVSPLKDGSIFNNNKDDDWIEAPVLHIPSMLSPKKSTSNSIIKLLSTEIVKSKIKKSISKSHVHRYELEEEIKSILNASPSGSYTIVYGPKGVGKTESILYTAIGKDAVINLWVDSATSVNDILTTLSKRLFGIDIVSLVGTEALIELIEACNVIPTIIFDVELGCSPDYVSGLLAVKCLAKRLAHTCRCIIVLSEPSDIILFRQYGDRYVEHYLYVDEPTYDEAKALLQHTNINVQLTDTEMEYLFNTLGTNPQMFNHMCSFVGTGERTLREYIDDRLAHAEQELVAFPHKAILKALKEHPEGVPPKYFYNQYSNGINLSDPTAVGAAMKRSNVMVYRRELGLYTLMSTPYKTALRSYTPRVPGEGGSMGWA